jgi:TldD protein
MASKGRKEKVESLEDVDLVSGTFKSKVNDSVEDHSLEEKMKLVKDMEERTRGVSKDIKSSRCTYYEIIDHKVIVTSDGAGAEVFDVKPEFSVLAVAASEGKMNMGYDAYCVTGGWKDLFRRKTPEEMSEKAATLAVDLLKASGPKGGVSQVILDPSLVGLICHEAIGHTVEGDFVAAGSIMKGKLGENVASPLVSLVDSGVPKEDDHAAGTLLVDDEGVRTRDARIIDKGQLSTYLVNREMAKELGVEPCGNARAFEHTNRPIIRMRNTYLEPGDSSLDEILEDTKEGYLLKGGGDGQADANAEFMFTAGEAYEINDGDVGRLLKNVTISGRAFDVLKSVDMISRDFWFDMGYGMCFKGQAAKVDGGGPYIRCMTLVGGTGGQ